MKRIAWLGWMLVPGAAAAQDRVEPSFTGAYAGPEASLQQHGFSLSVIDPETNDDLGGDYSRTGLAGGGFAGFDLAVAPRVRLGIEAGATIGGGGGGRADLPGGNRFELKPRWGYRAVARAGYVLGGRTMAYALVGYGAQNYRLRTSIFVEDAREWDRGVAYGLGVEHRVGRSAAIRIEARRIADSSNQLSLGIPFRF